jgi:TPP-dependent pyruvate/acetoin dehydrogenase alpha subunit
MAAKEIKAEAGENPLVPNQRLREIYVAMVEARGLEDAVLKRRRGASRRNKPISIRGQEAVRASVTLQLEAHDLVSDVELSAGMSSILGGDAPALLKTYTAAKPQIIAPEKLLALIQGTEQRLQMALGAALALKAQKKQAVVIAYIRKDELSDTAYRCILKPAAANELPIIFVVLPRAGNPRLGDSVPHISRVAGKAGVPGIPVDACDSVALYRVAQESFGRTRGGDGPVLIECIRWKVSGAQAAASSADPIEHLAQFMAGRKISTPAWFKRVEITASKRLKGRKKASKKA